MAQTNDPIMTPTAESERRSRPGSSEIDRVPEVERHRSSEGTPLVTFKDNSNNGMQQQSNRH